jgi:hypothetical protein
MKTVSCLLLTMAVNMAILDGCSLDTSMSAQSDHGASGHGASCFHSGSPDLPLFTLHNVHVAYSETIEAGRNVANIGEDPQVDLVVLIGEPDAPVDDCSVVYIHHDRVPGEDTYVVDGIWQALNAKRQEPFQSLPKEQRFLRVPRVGESLTLDWRLLNLDSFFANRVGVELTGGSTIDGQGKIVGFLGERIVGIEDDPMVCYFRLLYPSEI